MKIYIDSDKEWKPFRYHGSYMLGGYLVLLCVASIGVLVYAWSDYLEAYLHGEINRIVFLQNTAIFLTPIILPTIVIYSLVVIRYLEQRKDGVYIIKKFHEALEKGEVWKVLYLTETEFNGETHLTLSFIKPSKFLLHTIVNVSIPVKIWFKTQRIYLNIKEKNCSDVYEGNRVVHIICDDVEIKLTKDEYEILKFIEKIWSQIEKDKIISKQLEITRRLMQLYEKAELDYSIYEKAP